MPLFIAALFFAHLAISCPFNFRAPLNFQKISVFDPFFHHFDNFLGPFNFRAPIVCEFAPFNFQMGLRLKGRENLREYGCKNCLLARLVFLKIDPFRSSKISNLWLFSNQISSFSLSISAPQKNENISGCFPVFVRKRL